MSKETISMKEAVALAIAQCIISKSNEPDGRSDIITADDIRDLATAAIKAMREPSIDMLHSAVDRTGAGSGMSWSNRSPQGLFETGWQAMIDAALSQE